jgi:hypothetical protein
MDEGRERSAWNRVSLLCAVVQNSNPFREGKPVSPDFFNPYAKKRPAERKPLMISMDAFCTMIVGAGPPDTPK